MHGFQLKLMDFYGVTIVPKSSVLCFVSYHSINNLQYPNKQISDFFNIFFLIFRLIYVFVLQTWMNL